MGTTTTKREFHIGDVLSITTSMLVSPRRMDGVYDILGYMTGEPLFTHQLPRAARECTPELLRQHPQLAAVETPTFASAADVAPWLAEQVARYGETLPVAPLAHREAQYDTPIADLIEMTGDATKVIVVDP
jgi:hypothetical protein